MTSPDRPTLRIVAAVVTDDHGRTLVVRKRGTTAFMQPGGKVDPGESGLAAVKREVAEELDVGVADSDVTALGEFVAEAANEPGHLVRAQVFAVRLPGVPRAAAEIEEIRWIDPAAPGDIELAPLTRDAVFSLLRDGACHGRWSSSS